MEYCSAIKDEILPHATIMDGPRDHTEWSKSDRERQHITDITYMWNLTDNANELIYKAEIDSQTWKTYDYQRGKERGWLN